MSYNTWGISWSTSWGNSWGAGTPSPSPAPAVIDTFLPIYIGGKKEPIGNLRFVYDKAKTLPAEETIELQEAIEEFIDEPTAADFLPDMEKINLSALQANALAYDNFINQLTLLNEKISLLEKQQEQDDELMLFAILACTIN